MTNTTGFYPAIEPTFLRAVDVLVGITCVLSILGASLIILTYGAYRELRTTARQLLVNLSVADWILTASHFVGIFHYRTFIPQYNPHYDGSNTDTLCSVLGATDMFGSIASFLWTIALAGYMFTVIVLRRVQLAKHLVIPFYLICWGIPLALTIWFGVEQFFGFVETFDVISCFVRNVSDNPRDPENIYPEVLGYDGWSYLAFLTLPAFYLATFCYIRWKRARAHNSHPFGLLSWSTDVDMKLLLIPLIFLLLRMWSAIIDAVYIFLKDSEAVRLRQSEWIAAFVLLAAVGNSAQGAANAVLFCVFTRQVRRRLCKTIKSICTCLKCGHCTSRSDQWEALSEEDEPTTQFDNSLDLSDPSRSSEFQSTPLVEVSSGSSPRSSTNKTYYSTARSN